MKKRIPLIVPDLEFEDVRRDIESILMSGVLTSGPYVCDFERAVAERVGVDHAVATTSATTALHLALIVCGVGPGDEVLIPDFTFPATANAVIQTGATPVFVDSGHADFAMDPESARALISPRTRVILPVDPFGQPADHLTLERIATDAGLHLVVDAACSLGASRAGRECGAHGEMGCFSFHPRKVVTCGEGGMVTTNDANLADQLRLRRNHGFVRSEGKVAEFVEPAFNYRMTEIQAALGLSQMRRIEQILSDRRSIANRYDDALSKVSGVSVQNATAEEKWSYQSYVVLLDDEIDRNAAIANMDSMGIETTIGTYACHQHPAFRSQGICFDRLLNATRYANQTLTLPIVTNMSASEVDRVVEALVSTIGKQ